MRCSLGLSGETIPDEPHAGNMRECIAGGHAAACSPAERSRSNKSA